MARDFSAYLDSKLSDHDITAIELVVPPLDPALEVVEVNIVPVNGHKVNGAIGTALEELLHPGDTIRITAAARRTKGVTLGSERLDSILPSSTSGFGCHVSLTGLIDPLEMIERGSQIRINTMTRTH